MINKNINFEKRILEKLQIVAAVKNISLSRYINEYLRELFVDINENSTINDLKKIGEIEHSNEITGESLENSSNLGNYKSHKIFDILTINESQRKPYEFKVDGDLLKQVRTGKILIFNIEMVKHIICNLDNYYNFNYTIDDIAKDLDISPQTAMRLCYNIQIGTFDKYIDGEKLLLHDTVNSLETDDACEREDNNCLKQAISKIDNVNENELGLDSEVEKYLKSLGLVKANQQVYDFKLVLQGDYVCSEDRKQFEQKIKSIVFIKQNFPRLVNKKIDLYDIRLSDKCFLRGTNSDILRCLWNINAGTFDDIIVEYYKKIYPSGWEYGRLLDTFPNSFKKEYHDISEDGSSFRVDGCILDYNIEDVRYIKKYFLSNGAYLNLSVDMLYYNMCQLGLLENESAHQKYTPTAFHIFVFNVVIGSFD